jgi:hypothetical protein
MELGGFEPPTSWVRFKPAPSHPRSHPAWILALRAPACRVLNLDMRGYAAIVGVFRQKRGFLPDRATIGFNRHFKPNPPPSGAQMG